MVLRGGVERRKRLVRLLPARDRLAKPARNGVVLHPLASLPDVRFPVALPEWHLAHEPLPVPRDQPVLTRAMVEATSSSSSGVQGFTRTAAQPTLRASSSILDCAFAVSMTMGILEVT